MNKVLFPLLKISALVIAGVWLLNNPGHMVIDWLGYEVELAFSTFVISLTSFALVLWVTLSLLFWIFKIPFRLGNRYVHYNRKKGFEALYGALEARALGDLERFEKESEQVDILLKEKELSLYLKGESTLLQENYPLSEQYFYELAQTKRGKISGLMGLLRVAEAQNAAGQRWRVAQKLSEVAVPSRRLQIALYESALTQGKFEFALEALKPLLRNRLAEEKEVRALRAKAYLAREKALVKEGDEEGAREAAEDAYNALPSQATLSRYLPYLVKADKTKKAKKLLIKFLQTTFDRALFEELMTLEGCLKPLEKYDFIKQFYDVQQASQDCLVFWCQLALESELWTEAKQLVEHYRKTYGEDKIFFCLRASFCLAESLDFKKAISFYQKACHL